MKNGRERFFCCSLAVSPRDQGEDQWFSRIRLNGLVQYNFRHFSLSISTGCIPPSFRRLLVNNISVLFVYFSAYVEFWIGVCFCFSLFIFDQTLGVCIWYIPTFCFMSVYIKFCPTVSFCLSIFTYVQVFVRPEVTLCSWHIKIQLVIDFFFFFFSKLFFSFVLCLSSIFCVQRFVLVCMFSSASNAVSGTLSPNFPLFSLSCSLWVQSIFFFIMFV